MNLFGLVFVAAGVFSICGAWMDWDWFMLSRKSRFMVGLLGRKGARIFYGLLGIVVIVLGVLFILGIIADTR